MERAAIELQDADRLPLGGDEAQASRTTRAEADGVAVVDMGLHGRCGHFDEAPLVADGDILLAFGTNFGTAAQA